MSYNDLMKTHHHLPRGSQDLRDGCYCHKIQLEDVLPVRNEGRNANLEGWVDAGGCVGGPVTHDILRKAYTRGKNITGYDCALHVPPQCLDTQYSITPLQGP